MKNQIRLILTLLITIGMAMPSLAGARGLVLCLSGDGHVAIEAAHESPSCESLCGSESPDRERTTEDERSQSDQLDHPESHRCVDIAISVQELRTNRGRDAFEGAPIDLPAPVGLSAWAVSAANAADPMRFAACRPMDTGSVSLDAVRTVILRV